MVEFTTTSGPKNFVLGIDICMVILDMKVPQICHVWDELF